MKWTALLACTNKAAQQVSAKRASANASTSWTISPTMSRVPRPKLLLSLPAIS
jgi:hypothetical protein